MAISILVFSLNTQSLKVAESIDPEVVKSHRQGTTSTWIYQCEIPDFWIQLSEKIKERDPTIVIIGFQEDIKPGGYFHSHLLPEEMPKLGYKLFERTKLMGIGKTSFEGLMQADPYFRGLRLSVYLKNASFDQFGKQFVPATYTNSVFQNKGAVAIYLTLPDGTILAIINTHFPFDADSLKISMQKRDPYIRQDAVMNQNIFFNELYRKLFKESIAQPKHLLLFGDFNYRIAPFVDWSARETGKYLLEHLSEIGQYDELRYQMAKSNIYTLLEGVDGKGPLFAPTCKMKKGRKGEVSIDSYSLGSDYQRVPSHCDRILYSSEKMVCKEYDRFDKGIMNMSDHAGVIALFKI